MPMKFECMSLVCKMVKVFFILFSCAAADSFPVSIVAPNAAETVMNLRRDNDSRDASAVVGLRSAAAAVFLPEFFIVATFQSLHWQYRNRLKHQSNRNALRHGELHPVQPRALDLEGSAAIIPLLLHFRQGRPRFDGGGFVFEHCYYEVVHDLTLAYRI